MLLKPNSLSLVCLKIELIFQSCALQIQTLNVSTASICLGITIDKHVNWVAHTNKVASRISRTTGVLNRVKNVLPIYILKSIYKSLIMCHLNYGILVWGHNLNTVLMVQKRAVHIISCNKYIAHTEPMT